MRSLLFAPGGSAKMMAKSLVSGADVAIFDIEDAVLPDRKAKPGLVARCCALRHSPDRGST